MAAPAVAGLRRHFRLSRASAGWLAVTFAALVAVACHFGYSGDWVGPAGSPAHTATTRCPSMSHGFPTAVFFVWLCAFVAAGAGATAGVAGAILRAPDVRRRAFGGMAFHGWLALLLLLAPLLMDPIDQILLSRADPSCIEGASQVRTGRPP